jgi:hypothetical protein
MVHIKERLFYCGVHCSTERSGQKTVNKIIRRAATFRKFKKKKKKKTFVSQHYLVLAGEMFRYAKQITVDMKTPQSVWAHPPTSSRGTE